MAYIEYIPFNPTVGGILEGGIPWTFLNIPFICSNSVCKVGGTGKVTVVQARPPAKNERPSCNHRPPAYLVNGSTCKSRSRQPYVRSVYC